MTSRQKKIVETYIRREVRRRLTENVSAEKVLNDLKSMWKKLNSYNSLFTGKLGGRDAEVAHEETTKFLIRLIHAVDAEVNPKPSNS